MMKEHCDTCGRDMEHCKGGHHSIGLGIFLLFIGLIPGIIYFCAMHKMHATSPCCAPSSLDGVSSERVMKYVD